MNRNVFGVIVLCGVLMAWSVRAADKDITNQMPQVRNGQMTNSLTPPPPPETYPAIRKHGDEPRLDLNKDVSLGGSATSKSIEGNVRVPLPERKK